MKLLVISTFIISVLLITITPVTAQRNKKPVKTAAASNSLPAASLNGARVFIKYSVVTYPRYSTVFRPLILFPDGSAFDKFPKEPLTEFTPDTLRNSLEKFYIGQWKETGKTMTLNFPGKADYDRTRTLRKNSLGWFDGKGTLPVGKDYDIYYPVILPSHGDLLGDWKNKFSAMYGSVGGAAPMVMAGSEGIWKFNADGTFADAKESFSGSTTASMGEIYQRGEGNTDQYSNRKQSSSGKWRVDGPLLTIEKSGVRTIHIAFLMPYWSKTDVDLMVDGDRWERPDNK